MIALIIVGAIVVIVLIGVMLLCMNRDKVMRWSAKGMVNHFKTELSAKPFEGIDTVQFNRLADSFLVRLDTATFSNPAGISFVTTTQNLIIDKKVDEQDVYELSDAIVRFYPELEPLAVRPPDGESRPAEDTAAVAPDTLDGTDTVRQQDTTTP